MDATKKLFLQEERVNWRVTSVNCARVYDEARNERLVFGLQLKGHVSRSFNPKGESLLTSLFKFCLRIYREKQLILLDNKN